MPAGVKSSLSCLLNLIYLHELQQQGDLISRVIAGRVEFLLHQLVVEAESLSSDGGHLNLQDPDGGADGYQVEEDGGAEPGELLAFPVAETVETLEDLQEDGDTDLSVGVSLWNTDSW